MKSLIALCSILLSLSSLFATSIDRIIDVSFHYDQDADLAFRNSVDIGFEITYESGRIQRTAGLLNGLGGWQKLHLELEKGVRFSEGKLYYSRKKAMLAKDGITIIVKTKQKWQFEK
ncbi:MAG: hypothetical protein AAFP02_19335, partial [Bacteroidota bacterium]